MFNAVNIAIKVQNKAEKKEKKLAPPLLAETFLPNITQPFASAKSAIDHKAKNTKVIPEST